MLHALANHKASLRSFRGKGVRIPAEDVITSTVFGPLEFLSSSDRAILLERLFERLELAVDCDWASAKLDFWVRQSGVHKDFRAQYIEPDLLLCDRAGVAAIIEIKWGAPLGANELAGQWSCLDTSAQRRAVHLFLVREPTSYAKAIETERRALRHIGVEDWPLERRSWRAFATALDTIYADSDLPPQIREWARQVARMLVREHGYSMVGWADLGLLPVEPSDWRFRRSWFADLVSLEPLNRWWTA